MEPSTDSVQAVQEWLSSNGIDSKTLVGHGDWIGFSTTVEQANKLFDADFAVYKHLDTGKEEIRTLAYSIPSHLKPHIELAHPMIS
jgi:tripeptidyl-peptidase I